MTPALRFCSACGTSLEDERKMPLVCPRCGVCHHCGPALLVLTQIIARDRVLLLKRGVEPYRGTWAPPGGFVEHQESLERAAIREVWEEVRVELHSRQILPYAVISLPEMNQVYHLFVAQLPEPVAAYPVAPESLAVGWFSQEELRSLDIWAPGAKLHMTKLFEQTRAGRFDFYQYNEQFSRIISESGRLTYLDA